MPKPLELIALRAPAAQFDLTQGKAGLPKKILVLAWGNNATTKGPVICNETTVRELPAFNAAQNWDRPYMDYEHASLPGSPSYKGEPCDVASYSASIEVEPGVGIWYLVDFWTSSGETNVLAGNYADLSPVVKVNERNEVIGLHSVALCRHGATAGLVFLSAAAPVQHSATPRTANSSNSMTPEQLVAELAKVLGLAADTPPADILAALTTKMGESEKEPTAMKAKSEEDAKTLSVATKGDDTLKLLSTQLQEQGDQLKQLSATLEASQRGEVIAGAIHAGKQVPSIASAKTADGSYQMPLDQLKQLCAELPVTVPMEKRLSSAPPASDAADTAETAAVSSMTGVSPEDRAKYANR